MSETTLASRTPTTMEASTAALEKLEAEFERMTAVGPPTDETLAGWQHRVDFEIASLASLSNVQRARQAKRLDRFKAQLLAMQERKSRYLERRRQAARTLEAATTGDLTEVAGGPARSLLASGIMASLRQSATRSVEAKAFPTNASPDNNSQKHSPVAIKSEVLPGALEPEKGSVDRPPSPVPSSARETENRKSESRVRLKHVGTQQAPLIPTLQSRSQRLSRQSTPIISIEARLAAGATFSAAHEIAVKWLRRKGFTAPELGSETFDQKTDKGHSLSIVSAPEDGLWAMQAETADREIEGRMWRVEMVLLDTAPTAALGVTLTAISPTGAPEPRTSIPGLVSELVAKLGLVDVDDGSRLNAGPIFVRDQEALGELIASLRSSMRSRPVLVLSTYKKGDQLKQLLRPTDLSKKLSGLAKVIVLDREMSWPFNDAVGRRFAVAGACIRLFRPDFSPDDEPGRHPAWNPTELTALGLALNGLSDQLLQESAYSSLRALEREEAIPAFERVRQMVLRRQIESARRQADDAARAARQSTSLESILSELTQERGYMALLEEDNARLTNEANRLELELLESKGERDHMRSRVHYLDRRVSELERQLRERSGQYEPAFPSTWDDLEQWCDENLSDRVVVTAKAMKAARESVFEDVASAYRALWLLAEHYVPSRRQGGDFRPAFANASLEVTPVGMAADDHRYSSEYQTPYKRTLVKLDQHVKGSDNVDPRYGFRVYFHWHVKDSCAVVGWFPSHLTNSLT